MRRDKVSAAFRVVPRSRRNVGLDAMESTANERSAEAMNSKLETSNRALADLRDPTSLVNCLTGRGPTLTFAVGHLNGVTSDAAVPSLVGPTGQVNA
jgi:hypothetical protein